MCQLSYAVQCICNYMITKSARFYCMVHTLLIQFAVQLQLRSYCYIDTIQLGSSYSYSQLWLDSSLTLEHKKHACILVYMVQNKGGGIGGGGGGGQGGYSPLTFADLKTRLIIASHCANLAHKHVISFMHIKEVISNSHQNSQ